MIGFEERRWIAFMFNHAADALGMAINCVEAMARRDIETVRAENDAADAVCIQGAEVIKALRVLARRYER